MSCQNKTGAARRQACNACRHIVAGDVSMDDVDVFLSCEVRYLYRAEDAERISDRDLENIFVRDKCKAVPPIAGRPERDKDFMSPRSKIAAQVDDMPFGSGVVPR